MPSIFAAAPPLDSLKALLVKAPARLGRTGQELSIQISDVSRAHFYAPSVRDVFIRLLDEDDRSSNPNLVGKLNRTMYGTLDAAAQWAAHYAGILIQAGFRRGRASPCHFYHPSRDLWV